jgi:hypothetical protein
MSAHKLGMKRMTRESDIVERLRGCKTETSLELMKRWCEEAADELVRQSAVLLAQETEIERLRAALREICHTAENDIPSFIRFKSILRLARAALKGTP